MDEHISITSDRGGEMRVLGHSETEMADLCHVNSGHAEVNGLVHATSGQDTDNLVEERIALAVGSIEGIGKFLGRLSRDLEAVLGELVNKLSQRLLFGFGMPTENCEGRVECS